MIKLKITVDEDFDDTEGLNELIDVVQMCVAQLEFGSCSLEESYKIINLFHTEPLEVSTLCLFEMN